MASEATAKPPGRVLTAADLDRGGKTRLVTMQDLDRRTKAAQTAMSTKAAIMADLGGEEQLSTLERVMCENAAMAAVVLMDSHVRWLQGEPVPVAELATLTNSFNRTAQAIGLTRRPKEIVSIDSYLSKGDAK